MRITKKIISMLLVVSMIASFFAMTGFEASADLRNEQKTDFGIHFDDTTRKLKVLQLPDIQSKVGDRGNGIKQITKEAAAWIPNIKLFLKPLDKPIKVAIMGCAVNGPLEAKNADIGIAGGQKEGLLFKKGEIVKKIKK